MENGPFIVDLPIYLLKIVIFQFAMFNYQMVYLNVVILVGLVEAMAALQCIDPRNFWVDSTNDRIPRVSKSEISTQTNYVGLID